MKGIATAGWQAKEDRATTGQKQQEKNTATAGSKIQDILEVLEGRHNYSKAAGWQPK